MKKSKIYCYSVLVLQVVRYNFVTIRLSYPVTSLNRVGSLIGAGYPFADQFLSPALAPDEKFDLMRMETNQGDNKQQQ